MKKLILLKLIIALALCITLPATAATVLIQAGYLPDQAVPVGNYSFIVDSEVVGSGVIAQTMTTTLLNQSAGDYNAVIEVCNDAGCSDRSTQYTVPNVPNVDDITLTITVSRD